MYDLAHTIRGLKIDTTGMASPAPELRLAFCPEKQRLIGSFTHAVSEYLRLQSAQLGAVIVGRVSEFEGELEEARRRKERARLAIAFHQNEHGCC